MEVDGKKRYLVRSAGYKNGPNTGDYEQTEENTVFRNSSTGPKGTSFYTTTRLSQNSDYLPLLIAENKEPPPYIGVNDIQKVDSNGNCILLAAAFFRNSDWLYQLDSIIKKNLHFLTERKYSSIATPAHMAAFRNFKEFFEIFKEVNFSSVRDQLGTTPLQLACLRANLKVVKQIAPSIESVIEKDSSGFTPIHNAAFWAREDIIQYFYKRFEMQLANCDLRSNTGWTLLHCASFFRPSKKIIMTVTKQSEDFFVEVHGWTPILILYRFHPKLLEQLLSDLQKLDGFTERLEHYVHKPILKHMKRTKTIMFIERMFPKDYHSNSSLYHVTWNGVDYCLKLTTEQDHYQNELKIYQQNQHRHILDCFGFTDSRDEWLGKKPDIEGVQGLLLEYSALSLASYLSSERREAAYCQIKKSWIKLDITIHIVSAMLYLHEKNIIHGDLKSENILVFDLHIGGPHLKIIDFGTSAVDITQNGIDIQTDPRLFAHGKLTKEFDVQCFAIVLIEILLEKCLTNKQRKDVKERDFSILEAALVANNDQELINNLECVAKRCLGEDQPTFSDLLKELEALHEPYKSRTKKRDYGDFFELTRPSISPRISSLDKKFFILDDIEPIAIDLSKFIQNSKKGSATSLTI